MERQVLYFKEFIQKQINESKSDDDSIVPNYDKIENRIERMDVMYSDYSKWKKELKDARNEIFQDNADEEKLGKKMTELKNKIEQVRSYAMGNYGFSKNEITKSQWDDYDRKRNYILGR